MSLLKRAGIYHYDFYVNKKRYQGTCRTADRHVAEIVQQQKMQELGRVVTQRPEQSEPGVYFLLSPSTGLIKVGCSGNIKDRLEQIQGANAEPLHLIAKIPAIEYRKAEEIMHEYLDEYRHKGEWFKITARHVEAAILYWATGHPFLETNRAVKASRDKGDASVCPTEIMEAAKIVAERENVKGVLWIDLTQPEVLAVSDEASS